MNTGNVILILNVPDLIVQEIIISSPRTSYQNVKLLYFAECTLILAIRYHIQCVQQLIMDGYGNSRVHRFTPNGDHVMSWGEPGTDPGQFSLPHNLIVLNDGRVVICDRENFRIQVFTENGEYIEQHHFHRPQAISLGRGDDSAIYLTESRPPEVQKGVP